MRWILALMMLCTALPVAAFAQDLRATLMDVDRAFDRATAAKGIDGWVEFAADDAVFMPEGVDFVRGKEAVRKFYTPMFSRKGFTLRWDPIEAASCPRQAISATRSAVGRARPSAPRGKPSPARASTSRFGKSRRTDRGKPPSMWATRRPRRDRSCDAHGTNKTGDEEIRRNSFKEILQHHPSCSRKWLYLHGNSRYTSIPKDR